jgi:hypothetical protein
MGWILSGFAESPLSPLCKRGAGGDLTPVGEKSPLPHPSPASGRGVFKP